MDRLTEGKERVPWKAALTLYRLVVHARQLWTVGTLELGVDRAEAFAVADTVAAGDLAPVHGLVGEAADLYGTQTNPLPSGGIGDPSRWQRCWVGIGFPCSRR